jgi:hypothetical protein
MTQNNSENNPEPKTYLSSWRVFVKRGKKIWKSSKRGLRDFSTRYPIVSQLIQINFIYFFAVVDLLHNILTAVFSLGYMPEILEPVFPLLRAILQNPILKVFASPEKAFVLSYAVIELMIVSPVFNFSKLIKYNVLMIFSLLMIQGVCISYWDVLFHRQIASPVARWAYDGGAIIFTDKQLAISFFFNTFFIFLSLYAYLYYRAINGKFARLGPQLVWLTDSVFFWLRIKTPTMRFGKRKKERKPGKPKK